jgi:hypothetical protein
MQTCNEKHGPCWRSKADFEVERNMQTVPVGFSGLRNLRTNEDE